MSENTSWSSVMRATFEARSVVTCVGRDSCSSRSRRSSVWEKKLDNPHWLGRHQPGTADIVDRQVDEVTEVLSREFGSARSASVPSTPYDVTERTQSAGFADSDFEGRWLGGRRSFVQATLNTYRQGRHLPAMEGAGRVSGQGIVMGGGLGWLVDRKSMTRLALAPICLFERMAERECSFMEDMKRL